MERELAHESPRTPPPPLAVVDGQVGVASSTRAEARSVPEHEASVTPPWARVMFGLSAGLLVIGVAQLPLMLLAPSGPARATNVAISVASTSPPAPSATTSSSQVELVGTPLGAGVLGDTRAAIPPSPPKRAARILDIVDDGIEVVRTRIGKRTCARALADLGLPSTDVSRLSASLTATQPPTQCAPSDLLFVARARPPREPGRSAPTRAIATSFLALELEHTPGNLLRIRTAIMPGFEDAPPNGSSLSTSAPTSTALITERLELGSEHRRVSAGFVVKRDLVSTLANEKLDDSLMPLLTDVLASRHDLPAPSAGSTLKLVLDATYVGGHFDRWDQLVALEYVPRPGTAAVRLYHGGEPKPQGSAFFDSRAQQPVKGRYRMPLPVVRITSRFNPRRMHPVLHVPMPHNGTDFAAPTGTPVYAIAAGVVAFRGEAGPSGNLVTIRHDGDLESGYAHLSRFAPGVRPGTRVEAKTLIGYSGSTGRSTGPHLHLSIKRHGVFVDPLSLKLDAMRTVPKAERSVFHARKAEADAMLDRIEIGTRVPTEPGSSADVTASMPSVGIPDRFPLPLPPPTTVPSAEPSAAVTPEPAEEGGDEGPELDMDDHSQ